MSQFPYEHWKHLRTPNPAESPTERGDAHYRRVAAVDDVLLDIADLRGDDGTAVEASFELGDDPVPGEVPILPRGRERSRS